MSFLITLTFISKEKKCIFLRNQNALKNFIAIAVQLHPALCDPWTAAPQTSFSFTKSRSLLKLMSIELVMPSNHFILCHPLFLPSIFPSIRVFSNESVICLRVSETLREPEMTCPARLCLPSMAWLARPDPEVVPLGVRGLDCFGLILNFPESPWAVLIELLLP